MSRIYDFGTPSLRSLLPGAVYDALIAAGRSMTHRDGSLIHARGDVRPGVTVIVAGAVRVGNPGADGSFVTTSVLGAGHCIGEMTLFTGLARTHEAVAVGDTVVAQLSAADYRREADRAPALDQAIAAMMAHRLHMQLEFADDLRRLPLIVLVAKLLHGVAVRDEQGVVEASHDEIAAMLGASRVAVGNALTTLEQAGLIARGYRRVAISDPAAVRRWVAERSMLSPLR